MPRKPRVLRLTEAADAGRSSPTSAGWLARCRGLFFHECPSMASSMSVASSHIIDRSLVCNQPHKSGRVVRKQRRAASLRAHRSRTPLIEPRSLLLLAPFDPSDCPAPRRRRCPSLGHACANGQANGKREQWHSAARQIRAQRGQLPRCGCGWRAARRKSSRGRISVALHRCCPCLLRVGLPRPLAARVWRDAGLVFKIHLCQTTVCQTAGPTQGPVGVVIPCRWRALQACGAPRGASACTANANPGRLGGPHRPSNLERTSVAAGRRRTCWWLADLLQTHRVQPSHGHSRSFFYTVVCWYACCDGWPGMRAVTLR